ncbi:glutamine synthetase [Candidatus Thorarchaeota archaeon]|nr:MAG: glutamine synthetase [Candidatus Thorarchaeota archaeon]
MSSHRQPEFLRLIFTSITGETHSVEVGQESIEEALAEGVYFDGSSVRGYASVNSSDLLLKPVSTKIAPLPWSPDVAVMPCGVYESSGKMHTRDPRSALGRVAESAMDKGLQLIVGSELEFFLVRRPHDRTIEPADSGGYFATTPSDGALMLRRKVFKALKALGISATTHHHEVAPGQHEIGLRHAAATATADNVMLSKMAIAELAALEGLTATFMPKPFAGVNGSGMHIHLSLWEAEHGQNVFASAPGDLSSLAKSFVAGLLEHAASLAAIVAPTVNSFKRLRPGYEAPTRIAWGPMNRTTIIRVPQYNGSKEKARIEFRCPDPLCSPHLAFAAVLAAGLDGIDKSLLPPSPTRDDLFKSGQDIKSLPETLGEALYELSRDNVLRHALGHSIVDSYIDLRESEWTEYLEMHPEPSFSQITDWETSKYLLLN